jgi:hypothetical protein
MPPKSLQPTNQPPNPYGQPPAWAAPYGPAPAQPYAAPYGYQPAPYGAPACAGNALHCLTCRAFKCAAAPAAHQYAAPFLAPGPYGAAPIPYVISLFN